MSYNTDVERHIAHLINTHPDAHVAARSILSFLSTNRTSTNTKNTKKNIAPTTNSGAAVFDALRILKSAFVNAIGYASECVVVRCTNRILTFSAHRFNNSDTIPLLYYVAALPAHNDADDFITLIDHRVLTKLVQSFKHSTELVFRHSDTDETTSIYADGTLVATFVDAYPTDVDVAHPPTIDTTTMTTVPFDFTSFKRALPLTYDLDSSFYPLHHVRIEPSVIYFADGWRLLKIETTTAIPQPISLHRTLAADAATLFDTRLSVNASNIRVTGTLKSGASVTLTTTTPTFQYPHVEHLFPNSPSHTVTLTTTKLTDVLRTLVPLVKPTNIIVLSLKQSTNTLTVKTFSSDTASISRDIAVTVDTNIDTNELPVQIGVNCVFLLETINALSSPTISLTFTPTFPFTHNPIILRNPDDPTVAGLLMPMHLEHANTNS